MFVVRVAPSHDSEGSENSTEPVSDYLVLPEDKTLHAKKNASTLDGSSASGGSLVVTRFRPSMNNGLMDDFDLANDKANQAKQKVLPLRGSSASGQSLAMAPVHLSPVQDDLVDMEKIQVVMDRFQRECEGTTDPTSTGDYCPCISPLLGQWLNTIFLVLCTALLCVLLSYFCCFVKYSKASFELYICI